MLRSVYMSKNMEEEKQPLAEFWNSLVCLAQKADYQDVALVCGDGRVRGARMLLAMVFPHMKNMLRERSEEEVVVIMPDTGADEVNSKIADFLTGGAPASVKKEPLENTDELSTNEDDNSCHPRLCSVHRCFQMALSSQRPGFRR